MDYQWSPPDFTKPADPANPTPLRPPPEVTVPEWDPGAFATVAASDRRAANGTEWDRVVIAGQTLAAIASVDGDKDTRIDVKETPGSDGATMTQVGVSPAPITIRLRFLTVSALQEWADLVKYLQPIPGKPRTTPVDVYHPALAISGIKSLYLKTLGTPKVSTPGGPVEVMTRWLEFLPQKKAGFKTAVGSTSSGLGGAPKAAPFKKTHPSDKAGTP